MKHFENTMINNFFSEISLTNYTNINKNNKNYNLYTNKPHSPNKNSKWHSWNYQSQKISREFINEIKTTLKSKGSNLLFEYCYYLCNAIQNRKQSTDVNTPFAAYFSTLEKLPKILNEKDTGCSYDNLTESIANRYQDDSVFSNLNTMLHCGLITLDLKNFLSGYYVTIGMVGHKTAEVYSRHYQIAEYAAINSHSGYIMEKLNNFDALISESSRTMSERDIMLDLYLHCIYNEEAFPLSMSAPVVMFDKNNFKTNYTYRYLANRWHVSLGKVHYLLNKFKKLGYIDYASVPNHGTYIFVKAYSKFIWNIESVCPAYFDIVKDACPNNYIHVYNNFFYSFFKLLKENKKNLKNFIANFKNNCTIFFKNQEYKNETLCEPNELYFDNKIEEFLRSIFDVGWNFESLKKIQ